MYTLELQNVILVIVINFYFNLKSAYKTLNSATRFKKKKKSPDHFFPLSDTELESKRKKPLDKF